MQGVAEARFVCTLPTGLHARPASVLAEAAGAIRAECTLLNERTGTVANIKSVLSLIAADVRNGDACVLRARGDDADAAIPVLIRLVTIELEAYEASAAETPPTYTASVPRALRVPGVAVLEGHPVSSGIASGRVVIAGRPELRVTRETAGDANLERDAIDRAVQSVHDRLSHALAVAANGTVRDILFAHVALIRDVTLVQWLYDRVAQGASAERAVADAGAFFATQLGESGNTYLRERALDVHDLMLQLLDAIAGRDPSEAAEMAIVLDQPSVVVADTLLPRQVVSLDRQYVTALVLEQAGTTSHTVILARALGIPTLVGVANAMRLAPGTEVVVDATHGIVVPLGSSVERAFYQGEIEVAERRTRFLQRTAHAPCRTVDGRALAIGANAASAREAIDGFAAGADGVGLFRTEMLFMERPAPPSEDEQYETYARSVEAGQGKPVIIRALDVGGDKPLPYLAMPVERNPFLGYRGVRLYADHPALVRPHLRAIVRASAHGPIWLMAPMVSAVDEVQWFKAQIADVQRELEAEGIAFDPTMPIGAMIEVPAAALLADHLCAELDFFSIGTNDLSQYFMAADRDSTHVGALSSARNPAFLRLLRQTVDTVRAHGKWIGVCGEMAADVEHLPLLVALGVDEISVAPTDVALLKSHLVQLSGSACDGVLQKAITSARAADVDAVLAQEGPAAYVCPIIDADLVILDDASANKEAVVHALVSALYVTGRTDLPQVVEDGVWDREATYSTGLGHGFAIPHCKTDAVRGASLVVMKLATGVDWGSLDGAPVRLALLLATRRSDASNRHLEVFSVLARRLMHSSFREQLLAMTDANETVAFLKQELGIDA